MAPYGIMQYTTWLVMCNTARAASLYEVKVSAGRGSESVQGEGQSQHSGLMRCESLKELVEASSYM